MAKQKIGTVKTPSGSTPYEVYWDENTGEVYVAREFAGKASSKSEALHKADYYASTGRRL